MKRARAGSFDDIKLQKKDEVCWCNVNVDVLEVEKSREEKGA